MQQDQKDFLLKEYERLRTEVDESVKETRSLERNAVIASGAIWAWALVHTGDIKGVSFYILLWIPAIMVALSALRAWALKRHLLAMGMYLADVEKEFTLPSSLGWEQRFARSPDKSKSQSAIVFWASLMLVTILGAAVLGCRL